MGLPFCLLGFWPLGQNTAGANKCIRLILSIAIGSPTIFHILDTVQYIILIFIQLYNYK